MPVYENGKQTERTTPLDATLIEQTNDPFMLQDDEEFIGPRAPSISESTTATKLRNRAATELKQKEEEKKNMDEVNQIRLKSLIQIYSNPDIKKKYPIIDIITFTKKHINLC